MLCLRSYLLQPLLCLLKIYFNISKSNGQQWTSQLFVGLVDAVKDVYLLRTDCRMLLWYANAELNMQIIDCLF